MITLSPEIMLRAYACGIFPMAATREDPTLYWVDPPERGIFPLDGFHAPKSLIKTVRKAVFDVRIDSDFAGVLAGCAEATPDRPETWINEQIVTLFTRLHELGFAHSVECWRDGQLVGGLYGLALGGAFFGESMFSRQTDASKVALCHLIARLRRGGFSLLDTQFITSHLSRFGAIEIKKQDYLARLARAMQDTGDFTCPLSLDDVLTEITPSRPAHNLTKTAGQD